MIKIGLLGLGTVGTGVYEIVKDRNEDLKALAKNDIRIEKILVENIDKVRNVDLEETIITNDANEILEDPEINVVVEAIGGTKDAYKFIKKALINGKHVITANKTVVAQHMGEFIQLAEDNKKAFLYEASVAGGTPIVKPLKQHVNINDITEINGILNGTSNFILTRMTEDQLSFKEALEIAQKLGYAEVDPTDDIEGFDVRRKLAILASIAAKKEIKEKDIACRGITSIDAIDIEAFKTLKLTVKLLAKAHIIETGFMASVEPVLVEEKSILGVVNDACNLVSVTGHLVGELKFFGQGAGKNPTANAIVCDLIDVISGTYKNDIVPKGTLKPLSISPIKSRYYIRASIRKGKKLEERMKESQLFESTFKKGRNNYFITKDTNLEEVENTVESLKKSAEGCCYVKIHDGINPSF